MGKLLGLSCMGIAFVVASKVNPAAGALLFLAGMVITWKAESRK